MDTHKTTARTTGLLFLLPLLTYGSGNAVIASLTGETGYLATLGEHRVSLTVGGLLLFLNSFFVTLIGVMLLPVLRRHHERIAIGYLVTRMAEALLLSGGLTALFLLVPVAGEYETSPAYAESMARLALQVNFITYQLAMLVLGLGSIRFCGLLFSSRLVPRWLALWGGAGYGLLAAGAVCELFGIPIGILLSVPGGLFEVGVGLWLLVRGFNFVPVPQRL